MYVYSNLQQQYLSQAIVSCELYLGEVHLTVLYYGTRSAFTVPLQECRKPSSLKDLLLDTIEETCGMDNNPPDIVWFYNDADEDVPALVAQAYRQLCAALGNAQSVQTAFIISEEEIHADNPYAETCIALMQQQTPWHTFIADSFAELLQEIVEQSNWFMVNSRIAALKSYLVNRADALTCMANPIGPMTKVDAMAEVVSVLDLLNMYRMR